MQKNELPIQANLAIFDWGLKRKTKMQGRVVNVFLTMIRLMNYNLNHILKGQDVTTPEPLFL